MASSRPSKRQRPDDGGSYHETIPFLGDFYAVHAREGRLLHVGSDIGWTAPPERSLQHTSDLAWMTATSWRGPPDDLELALDPTGDWYDETVDGEVMELTDVIPVIALPKKKRSKVSVSKSISPLSSLTHRMLLETAACCLEGASSTIVLGRNYPFCRERGLSGCKGLPRLSSTSHYPSCIGIPLPGVFRPRPCMFILLPQATSVPSPPSNFGQ
jgi:hypothetical protein